MQDRFKFRIFSKAVKKFIYFDDAELSIDREYMGLLFRSDHLYMGNYEEIQQCTGLKDKNGKLIYEGDIVLNSCLGLRNKISWDDEAAAFMFKAIRNKKGFGCTGSIYAKYCEVIGNIYKNQELLEVKND